MNEMDLSIPLPPLRRSFGVDISADYVAIVRSQQSRSGIQHETLIAESSQDISQAVQQPLATIRSDTTLGLASVSMAMPVTQSSIRWLTAPFPSLSKARKVLPSLLDIQLPFPIEKCVYGFPALERREGKVHALAIAAPHEAVEQRIEEAQGWKIDPHRLDYEGLALWDQYQREHDVSNGFHVVIYLGIDRTVWVAGMAGTLLSAWSSRIGAARLSQSDDAIQEWSNRSLRATALQQDQGGQTGRTTIHWCGPGCTNESLKTRSQANLESLQGNHRTDPEPGTFLARALSTRALQQPDDGWDFRRGPYVQEQAVAFSVKAKQKIAAIALVTAGLLLALNLGFDIWVDRQEDALDRRIRETALTLTGLPRVEPGQEVLLAERALAAQAEQVEPFLRALGPSRGTYWQLLLAHGQVDLLTYDSIGFDDDSLRAEGTAQSRDLVEQLETALQGEGWEPTVQLRDAADLQRVHFRLTARRAP